MVGIQCTNAGNGQGYDLLVQDGSIVVGETTAQNQAFILMAHKGDYKEHPLLGVGLTDILNGNDFAAWQREITEQLEADGQRITQLELTAQGLTLAAEYK